MEEKVLIKNEAHVPDSFYKRANGVCIALGALIGLIVGIAVAVYNDDMYVVIISGSILGGMVVFWLLSFVVKAFMRSFVEKVSLTVTDKRIYGTNIFGKRMDLPIDNVASITISKLFWGVSFGTSSGRITFFFVINNAEFHEVVSKLLIERQQKPAASAPVQEKGGEADELKKYKDLLDAGAITQEEYDAKKKQLLGL